MYNPAQGNQDWVLLCCCKFQPPRESVVKNYYYRLQSPFSLKYMDVLAFL